MLMEGLIALFCGELSEDFFAILHFHNSVPLPRRVKA